MGDSPFRSPARTEIAQDEMRVEVSEFADEEESEGRVCDRWIGGEGGRGIGAIYPICHIEAGEEPVVSGVFKDVEEGHGGGGEAVDEEGFEFTF